MSNLITGRDSNNIERVINVDASGNLQVDIVSGGGGSTGEINNAVGTNTLAGPGKCLSIAGTDASGNIRELNVDSSGNLQVDINS